MFLVSQIKDLEEEEIKKERYEQESIASSDQLDALKQRVRVISIIIRLFNYIIIKPFKHI